jgi:hypothetical protein
MKASGAISSIALEGLLHLLVTHQIVERVVQRAQIGVDLLRQVAGQKAQALAGFHGRAGQHDALHGAALQRVHGAGHGQIGLAGAGRADAEADVVLGDVFQIQRLVGRAGAQIGAARSQLRAVRSASSISTSPASMSCSVSSAIT